MSDVVAGVIGGVVGGGLGVVGATVTSYWGPRKFAEWKERRLEEREEGPRKKDLLAMLEDVRFPNGRYLTTLCEVTGTSEDHAKRLLIEIGARGIRLKNGPGWVLRSRMPVDDE